MCLKSVSGPLNMIEREVVSHRVASVGPTHTIGHGRHDV